MFTGLIQQIGNLVSIEASSGGARLFIGAGEWRPPLSPGESIAASGVCLTVCEIGDKMFACDVLQETLERTTLGSKKQGGLLNLERAIALGGSVGGHLVTGHVDGTGIVASRETVGRDLRLRISCSRALANEMTLKGSVACDGVSLTITRVSPDSETRQTGSEAFFEAHLIPFTRSHTTLDSLRERDPVNIETDIIGKYVRRQMTVQDPAPRVTMDRLRDAGFGE